MQDIFSIQMYFSLKKPAKTAHPRSSPHKTVINKQTIIYYSGLISATGSWYYCGSKEGYKMRDSFEYTLIFPYLSLAQAIYIIILLTLRTRQLTGLTMQNIVLFYQNSRNFKGYFMKYLINTRHVCTHFNAFSMVIPNIVIKLNDFDIFEHFVHFF